MQLREYPFGVSGISLGCPYTTSFDMIAQDIVELYKQSSQEIESTNRFKEVYDLFVEKVMQGGGFATQTREHAELLVKGALFRYNYKILKESMMHAFGGLEDNQLIPELAQHWLYLKEIDFLYKEHWKGSQSFYLDHQKELNESIILRTIGKIGKITGKLIPDFLSVSLDIESTNKRVKYAESVDMEKHTRGLNATLDVMYESMLENGVDETLVNQCIQSIQTADKVVENFEDPILTKDKILTIFHNLSGAIDNRQNLTAKI